MGQAEQPGDRRVVRVCVVEVDRVGRKGRCGLVIERKGADEVAIGSSDFEPDSRLVPVRDDFLGISRLFLCEVRNQDASVPPRARHGQAQHAAPRGGCRYYHIFPGIYLLRPVSSRTQRSYQSVVPELCARLGAPILSVGSRLPDRQRRAEIRQHDEVTDVLVRERARRGREPVQADLEGGRVLKVEHLVCRPRTGLAPDPEQDGQTGRDRGQFDRDAGDFVALAVIAQVELHGVLLGEQQWERRSTPGGVQDLPPPFRGQKSGGGGGGLTGVCNG